MLTAEQYKKIYDWFTARPAAKRVLLVLNGGLPATYIIMYAVLLVWMNVRVFRSLGVGDWQGVTMNMQALAGAIFVPGVTFIAGTALRKRLNRPRPYETPGYVSLVYKTTRGQAFPSRHALSAAVIAMAWMSFSRPVGLVLVVLTLALCATRVLVGVHAPRDVVCGALIGFAAGAIGMLM